MATNFDEILNNLHDNINFSDTEINAPIIVTQKREFQIPQNYNTVIAYEGDVNSQIITFRIPLLHEGHDLSKCHFQKLKWKNKKNLIEGTSKLSTIFNQNETTFDASWEVPPEAFSAAGQLEISLSFYDIYNRVIAFSWNTPVLSSLTVGSAFSDIGEINEEDFYLPAENEILLIDEESRQIVAPSNYNNVFCNYGDEGISIIYFRIKKKIHGIDLTAEDVIIDLNVGFDTVLTKYSNKGEEPTLFVQNSALSNDTGLVYLIWNIPPEITYNSLKYTGNITISITISQGKKKWTSRTYDKLNIGKSFIVLNTTPIEPSNDWVNVIIENYLNSHDFIISAE